MLESVNNQTSASKLNYKNVQTFFFLSFQLSENLNASVTKTVTVSINLTEILTSQTIIVFTDIIIFISIIAFTFKIFVSVLKIFNVFFASDSFCILSDKICNFSKEIENSVMCIQFSISKKHYFVKFSSEINTNNLRNLTLVIQECDAIQKVLHQCYINIQNFKFSE